MKFVLLALSALTFVSAYDFEDFIYNDVLVNQLSVAHLRPRRHTERKCPDPKSCCPKATILGTRPPKEEECFEEVGINRSEIGKLKTLEQKDRYKCLFECFLKKKGYLDANGTLLKDELSKGREKLKKRIQQEWLESRIDEIYDRCLDDLEPVEKRENECNDIGMKFSYCLWRRIQLQCPSEKQVNPQKCEALQANLKERKVFSLSSKCH